MTSSQDTTEQTSTDAVALAASVVENNTRDSESIITEAATSAAVKRSGLLWVVLVIAVLLSVAGFAVYHLVQRMQADIAAIQAEQITAQQAIDTAVTAQQTALTSLAKTQEQQQHIISDIVSADRSNWVLAEAEYLVRIANQRLLVSRDIRGAIDMLESADKLLAGGNDGSSLAVRQALASDLVQLKAAAPSDSEGAYTKLEALLNQTAKLQTAADVHAEQSGTPAPEVATVFTRVQDVLATVGIYLERNDAPVHVPVTRKEAELLRQNVRLMLQQAQLALLQRDAVVYTACLTHAQEWITQYFAPTDATSQLMHDELAALAVIPLAASLPDINKSLNALHEDIRQHYARVPGASAADGSVPAASSEAVPK